jgi:hypothetical protein
MLQRTAPRLRAHELDTVIVAQHPYVIAHDAQRGAELQGEITGARDALAEPLQDPGPQRMGQRLRDPSLRRAPNRARSEPGGGHGRQRTGRWGERHTNHHGSQRTVFADD